MPLHPVYGHEALRKRLAVAMASGKLPPALLLAGPQGVGKQRLGLWIAQGMVCERGPGEPCGGCHACRLAGGLGHPDIHWFFPIPRPRAEESKQVEEAEDALAAAIEARRHTPVWPRPDGLHGLFLPLVRTLHKRAQMRPVMARAKVFVVAEANRLVPQASSPEAANAMLKLLEEPPPDTFLVLTSSEPAALLPTIRSRLVQVRVGRLTPSDIARFLTEVLEPPLPRAEAARRAELCGGSLGAALELGGEAEEERAAAGRLLAAAKEPSARYRYALRTKPFGARAEFTATLDAAAELLRDQLARRLQGSGAGGGEPDLPATRLLAQLNEIQQARRLAQGNVNPQLMVVDLLRRLAVAGT